MYRWRVFSSAVCMFVPSLFAISSSTSARLNPNPSNLNCDPCPKTETLGRGWENGDGAGAATDHQVCRHLGKAATSALPFSLHVALVRTFTI